MTERTLIIVKPDAIQRHLAGEIIARFERKSFKLVAAKFMHISKTLAQKHYSVHEDQPFFNGVVEYLASSPSLVMVWQGEGIIEMSRKLMGTTFGYEAQPGTIRGDLGCSTRYNLVHGSDSADSAEKEISLFFKPSEIVDYSFSDSLWLYGKKD